MSSILNGKLKNALDETFDSYKKLMKDLGEGKLSMTELKEKHEGLMEATEELVEKLLELPEPDLIIEICDGVVQDVYTTERSGPVTYVVYEADTEFDHYDIKDAKPYKDYETIVEDLDASYLTVSQAMAED